MIYRLLSWNPWQGVFLRLVELAARMLAMLNSKILSSRGPDAPIRIGHRDKKGELAMLKRNTRWQDGANPLRAVESAPPCDGFDHINSPCVRFLIALVLGLV